MEWFDSWTVLKDVIGFVGPVTPLVPLIALERSKFWRRNQTTGDTNTAPRRVRREHRRPTTQLPRTYRNCTAEMLAQSIGSSGRVPIDQHKNRPWPFSVLQKIRDDFVSSSTKPKSAFTLADWEFQPIAPTSVAKRYPYTGGSILRLSLNPHENRSHLKRSLRADRSKGRARRLVVIASVQDMFEPTSLVRCIVVKSNTLRLEDGDAHVVTIRTTDPRLVAEPTVHRLEQKEVPADALWLIVPTSHYRSPSTLWGEIPEYHSRQTTPSDPRTPESDNISDEDPVKEPIADRRNLQIVMWVSIAPGMWIYIWVYTRAYIWCLGYLFPQVSAPISVTAFWLAFYLIPLLLALLYLAVTAFRAWCWRCRDSQTKGTWQGRTEECLIMGDLLGNGPFLNEKEWKEYYAHVFHTSDGTPAGSS